ncbi:MAG TPA: hypothetical protein VFI22_12065 [Thermomicrobiales bacterium]|nr:hypothetical protein [Thermomicrobiales bacterium]
MSESSELRSAIARKLWDEFRGGTAVRPLTTSDFDYLANERQLTGDVDAVLEALAADGVIAINRMGDDYVVRAVLSPERLAQEAGQP